MLVILIKKIIFALGTPFYYSKSNIHFSKTPDICGGLRMMVLACMHIVVYDMSKQHVHSFVVLIFVSIHYRECSFQCLHMNISDLPLVIRVTSSIPGNDYIGFLYCQWNDLDGWSKTNLGLYSLRRHRLIINMRQTSDRLMFIIAIPILVLRCSFSEWTAKN